MLKPNKLKANKIIATMLTLVMLIAMIPANVFAADATNINVIINGTTKVGGKTLQAAVDASKIGDTAVTSLYIKEDSDVIEADWKYLKNLTALTTFEIDSKAYRVANIPDWQDGVAIFPKSIVTATVPQAITIGEYAFNGCTLLTTVSFPAVTSIGEGAFNGCKELTTANSPEVTSLGAFAFYGCTLLTTVSFPKVTSIGVSAFNRCTALTEASIPEATSIGVTAFEKCSALTTVSFPKVTSIGVSAFSECTSLTTASFPKATSLSEYAFAYCPKLATLKLPATAPTTVGTDAFGGCPADRMLGFVDADGKDLAGDALATAVTAYKAKADADGKWYGWTLPSTEAGITIVANNVATPVEGETLEAAIEASKVAADKVTSLKITAGKVTEDDWKYLSKLTAMATFEIADDKAVTEVANIPDTSSGSLFPTSIVNVTVPQAITIGNRAFYKCALLTTANFPKAASLGNYAFYGCKVLATISFPQATSIGESAFSGCTALTTTSFPAATSINNSAFNGCTVLTTANFPEAASLGDYAFYDCKVLATANFPEVTSIGKSAFYDCKVLATANFPKATSIDAMAFYGCTKLATLKLPATPPTVGTDVFKNCSADRTLGFVDADGKDLTGDALATTITTYKAFDDGDKTDNLWNGWKLPTGEEPPAPPIDPAKPQAKTIKILTNQAKEQIGTVAIDDFFKSVPAGAVIKEIKLTSATNSVLSAVATLEDGKIKYTSKASIKEKDLEEVYDVTFTLSPTAEETTTLTFITFNKSTPPKPSTGGGSYTGGGTTTYTNHTPEIISGAKQSIVEKNNETAPFRIDRPFVNFLYVEAGKTVLVEGTHYTVKEGSTIVTLLPAYTNTLPVGTHTVRVEFIDGYAVLEFEVKPKATIKPVAPTAKPTAPPASNNPQTGDSWFAGLFR